MFAHFVRSISRVLDNMCGIFGIYGHKDAAKLTYLGLYALQHRGQESAGIAASSGKKLIVKKGMGLTSDVFTEKVLAELPGELAIGHVRYSTTGASNIRNTQPFMVEYSRGSIAVGHNGNLVNAEILHDELEAYGSIFQTTMDSEIIVHLIARGRKAKFRDNLIDTLLSLQGAFSLVMLTQDQVIGVRDPHGWRPLWLGAYDGAYVLASESCALDLIQAKRIREVEPGEVVFIDKSGLSSVKPFKETPHAFCIFEFVYFARPDSDIFGGNVYLARKELGRRLAKECPVDADLVVPIPDSGNFAALGFSEASGIPYESAITRNHYIGRTFIQPSQEIRDLGVKVKLNPIKAVIKDKRIVIIEDSIVRGTTSRTRVRTLRDAGAREVHMRVSCPPHISPCYFGIDFPSKKELIAANHSIEDIRKFLNLDSLGYLSLEGMLASMPIPNENFCTSCYTGKYPIEVSKNITKDVLER